MADPLWVVKLLYQDAEGNQRQTSLRLLSSLTAAAANTAALALADIISDVSDAVLIEVSISKRFIYSPIPVAPIGADVSRQALTFYRNAEDVYELLAIPSLKIELLETTGAYAGVRLLDAASAPMGVYAALEEALSHTAKADGTLWDYLYINGGLML